MESRYGATAIRTGYGFVPQSTIVAPAQQGLDRACGARPTSSWAGSLVSASSARRLARRGSQGSGHASRRLDRDANRSGRVLPRTRRRQARVQKTRRIGAPPGSHAAKEAAEPSTSGASIAATRQIAVVNPLCAGAVRGNGPWRLGPLLALPIDLELDPLVEERDQVLDLRALRNRRFVRPGEVGVHVLPGAN